MVVALYATAEIMKHHDDDPSRPGQDFENTFATPLAFLALAPLLYCILIQSTGKYLASSGIYVYQNPILQESLDRMNNTKLGEEFISYFDSFIYTLK